MKRLTPYCFLAAAACAAAILSACVPLDAPLAERATEQAVPPAEDLTQTNARESEWTLVVIGDSTLGRLGRAYASQIENDVGVRVVLDNHVVPELSAGRLLEALQMQRPPLQSWEMQLADELRQAEVVVVVIFVNPLDSVDPDRPDDHARCFDNLAPESCSSESFEAYTADLEAIWAKILELRAGQPTILRATDTYVPLVASWQESGILEPCTGCWERISDAARIAAESYGIPFLSRYDAFNGVDHDEDPGQKGYIVSDGVHPSDLAAEYTAELLSQLGYEPVSPP